MAMTEEQKQRARENLARAREAKKAKAAEEAAKTAEAVAVAQPKVDSAAVSDHDVERSARADEKATIAAFKADDKVPYVIPFENGVDEGEQNYVCSYNGVFYNLKRGEQLLIPKGFAAHLDRRLRLAREAAKRVSDFSSPRGKQF